MSQTKKKPGLKPSESPHLPLVVHTHWGFGLLLSPNPSAKPGCNHKPMQTMCHQNDTNNSLQKVTLRLKAFDSPDS